MARQNNVRRGTGRIRPDECDTNDNAEILGGGIVETEAHMVSLQGGGKVCLPQVDITRLTKQNQEDHKALES